MSTSSQTPLTTARLSEEQLIGASVLVVLTLALPIVFEGGVLIAALVGVGSILTGIATAVGNKRNYTTRAQSRIALGGALLTVTASIVAFTTTVIVGAVFLVTASVLICGQLLLKF